MNPVALIEPVRVPFQIPVAPGVAVNRFVYAYIVFGRRITLIDSGVQSGEALICDALERRGRGIGDVARIILTHAHPDHIGSAAAIQRRTGCEVWIHTAERAWVEDVDLQARQRPVPGFHKLVGGSVAGVRLLEDCAVIDLGEAIDLHAIHTPGHSPGSTSLLLPAGRAIFCGDAVPQVGNLPIYDDPLESIRSIRRLAAVIAGNTLFSSWDEPRQGPEAMRALEAGIDYLQFIHDAVRKASGGKQDIEPMELCRQVVTALGLPPVAVNPLVARSLASHLPLLEAPDI